MQKSSSIHRPPPISPRTQIYHTGHGADYKVHHHEIYGRTSLEDSPNYLHPEYDAGGELHTSLNCSPIHRSEERSTSRCRDPSPGHDRAREQSKGLYAAEHPCYAEDRGRVRKVSFASPSGTGHPLYSPTSAVFLPPSPRHGSDEVFKTSLHDRQRQGLFFSNIAQSNQPPSARLTAPHYGPHSMASGPISSEHSPDQRDPYHMWGPPLSELQALSRRQSESDRKKSVDVPVKSLTPLASTPRRDSSIQRIFDSIHKEAGIA